MRERIYDVIFGTDTVNGQRFDILLIWMILISVAAEMLNSIPAVAQQYSGVLFVMEWAFTLCFTVEYLLRLYVSPKPLAYATSFFGIIDLLAIIPTYLALFYAETSYLVVIRLLRVLRIFRVLKMLRYLREAQVLLRTLRASSRKIIVFFMVVLIMAVIFGSLIYVVEGAQNGFSSIPKSIYWAIVTITTVGYGDIVPITVVGKFIASLVMLTGYSIIAVPTGIITAELAQEMTRERVLRACKTCHKMGHERDADYCRFCGGELESPLDPMRVEE